MALQSSARSQRIWLLLPAFLALFVYLNTLANGFVWDDRRLIVEDPAVHSTAYLGEVLTNDFFLRQEDDTPYGYYRPVVTLSYMADFAVWKLDPMGFHITNIALHVACTLLVGLCLLELGVGRWVAILAATAFAVHPIHTETVAWIAGRTDLLSFAFAGLALWLHLRSIDRSDDRASGQGRTIRKRSGKKRGPGKTETETPRWRRARLVGLSVAAFFLSLLAKEMGAVLVLWVPIIHYFVLGRGWRRAFRAALPYGLALAAYLVWRFAFLDISPPGDATSHPLWVVLLSAPPLLARYLLWLVWPVGLNAYVQNPYVESLEDPRLLAAAILLLGLAALAWRNRKGSPLAITFAIMLAVSFLPVLNIVRVAAPLDMGNVMAERFCYFPSFPFVALLALLAVAACDAAVGQPWTRRLATLAVIVSIALGAHLTIDRNRDWKDERTFFEATLSQTPDSVLLNANLANEHIRNRRVDEADRLLRRAEELGSKLWTVRSSRIFWYVSQERYREALPLQERIAASAVRGEARARNNLAFLYRMTGRKDEAKRMLLHLVHEGRAYPDVHINLAEIYRSQGYPSLARKRYRLALEHGPGAKQVIKRLGSLELEEGDLDAAEALYREFLALQPEDADMMNDMALLDYRRGDLAASAATYAAIVSRDPDYVRARINRAQVLVELGEHDEARRELEEAARRAAGTKLGDLAHKRLVAMDGGLGALAP